MLVDQIILHEGLKLKPYVDSVGKVTIGVGRNLTDNGITSMEAMLLLDHDLDAAVADCASFPWFAKLDAIRQRVVVDMRFNLGPTRFRRFAKMLVSLESGDFVLAADQMLKSKWATQVKSRAQRLARMMATGLALLVLVAVPLAAQPLGGGWDQVPVSPSGEYALKILLPTGAFPGDSLCQELKRLGYGERGCAYYAPGQHGPNAPPMYALGSPHDYVALDNGVWDLIGFDLSLLHASPGAQIPGAPSPTPAPPPPTLDLSSVLNAIAALQAEDRADQRALEQQLDALSAKVDSPGWFTKIASNRYVQITLAAIATCASTQCWKAGK